MKVDLPAPLGPRIAVCSPAAMRSVRRSRMRAPPSTTLASCNSSSGSVATAVGRGAGGELAIEIEDRRRIGLDQAELGDDFARDLLLFHLLGQEPLQLGHLGERLFPEAQLVEGIDLLRDPLLVRQRLLEHLAERVKRRLRLVDRPQVDRAVAGEREVEQLQCVHPLLVALQAQPLGRAEKPLLLAERGHRQIGIGRLELRVDLFVDRVEHGRVHVESNLRPSIRRGLSDASLRTGLVYLFSRPSPSAVAARLPTRRRMIRRPTRALVIAAGFFAAAVTASLSVKRVVTAGALQVDPSPAQPVRVGAQAAGSFADATGHSGQSHLVYAANAGVWWLFTLTSPPHRGSPPATVPAHRSPPDSRPTASWAAAARSASSTSTTRRPTSFMRRLRWRPTGRTASPATSAPA